MLVRRSPCTALGLALLLCASHTAAQVLPALASSGQGTVSPDLTPMAAPSSQVLLSTSAGLDFGTFVAGSGGTVTIDSSGARSHSAGVILVNSSGSGAAAVYAAKSDNGNANKAVILSLPANGQVSLTNGANSMSVNNFTMNAAASFVLTSAGAAVGIGATLSVGANQAPGQYAGSFPVTVNYQ